MFLSGADIRDRFISYFRDKRGHQHLPSSSLIPDNPTLLLTSAGMVQFVPIFLGQAPPLDPPRAVTAQKCARAGGKDSDIENVGRTARHHSFFEMMGNFSFGDYFKKEIIPWAWEFVTEELKLEPDQLSVSIFRGDDELAPDDEAFDIWHKKVGVPADRIFRMSKKDNFWGPPGPTGPCGPCSEIYYDRGAKYGCSTDPDQCGIGKCECDRYLEIWNLVFMELFKDESGKFTPLARKNVDTGLGLDRVALVMQEKDNTFETDLLFPILQEVSKVARVPYTGGLGRSVSDESYLKDVYLKIITDHARCVAFLVADGVRMSNVGRGYVLRFITRRAARFGRLLGISEPFIYKLVEKVVEVYGLYYTELVDQSEVIKKVLKDEEERFLKTIDRGMTLLEELLHGGEAEINGAQAFNLYSTFGFPIELTREIASERGKIVNMEEFSKAKKEHEQVSAGSKFNVIIAGDDHLAQITKQSGGTKFTGYSATSGEGHIVALIKDGKVVDALEEGEEADVVLDSTPFYAESGGQLGDQGKLENQDSKLIVLDTKKHDKLHLHRVRALAGSVEPGVKLKGSVDAGRREATVLHHSTAHIFHAAIRELFGKQVVQAGSQVGPNTMRFDFTLDRQPSPQEMKRVEAVMNEWVRSNAKVYTEEMPIEEAKRTGALAMFGEKYGDIVRVVRMGDFSIEFCGGTHISNTGEIGPIVIISEGSVSSGQRRVEAVSGPVAWRYIAERMNFLDDAANKLRTRPAELTSQIDRLQDQLKQKEKLVQSLEERLALLNVAHLLEGAQQVNDVSFIGAEVEGVSGDALKKIAEDIRNRPGKFVVVLASTVDREKVALVSAVSDALVQRGISAGTIIKETAQVIGGTGGGRPQLAQAGGKDIKRVKEALERGKQVLTQILEQNGQKVT
jgi:alanyl-tRNA synthetase